MTEAGDGVDQLDAMENGVNLDVAQDLRNLAEWIEAHPELPRVSSGSVYFGLALKAPVAREVMTTLAGALGDRATEQVEKFASGHVSIEGTFGRMRVRADASPNELGGISRVIEYPPIIPVAPVVDLPVNDEDIMAAAGASSTDERPF